MERHLESGLTLDLYGTVIAVITELASKEVKSFNTLESFVEQHSKYASPNVRLDNVGNLFISFFCALMFVVFVFLFALCRRTRKRRLFRRRLMRLLRAIR